MSVTYNDVVNHVKLVLSKSFTDYSIYSEEVKEGMKRPAFHINLLPEMSINFNKYYREQNVLVDVAYFSDEEEDLQSKEKNLDMASKLQNVFNMDLKVLDRFLNIQNLTYDIVDRVLHTTFNLSWFNENEVTENYLKQFNIIKQVNFADGFGVSSAKCVIITSDGRVFKAVDGGFYVECTADEIKSLKDQGIIPLTM